MATFSWNTGTYGGSAFVLTAGWGWYNTADESFPSANLAANGKRPILISKVEFLGGGAGGKSARFKIGSGSEKTSGLVADPDSFRFVVRATAGGTTEFPRNTGAAGTISATNTSDTLSGQLPGRITYTEVPTAPAITSLTQSSLTEASVEWSAPSDNGGSAITGYRVDWSTSPTFAADVHTSYTGAVLSAVLTGVEPASTIYVRVSAQNAVTAAASTTSVFSATDDLIMVAAVGDVDGWASYGTDPAGVTPLVTGGVRRGTVTPLGDGTTGLIREYVQTGSGGPTSAGARGLQRTFAGLTVGETYRLNGVVLSLSDTTPSTTAYRWAVVGISEGSWATITDDETPADVPEYEFVATSTTHTVQLQADAASWSGDGYFERVALYGVRLEYVPNPTDFFCQDVELETSLANHYTVACATLGAAWWVGADNVTRFRQAEDSPGIVATFSDEATAGTIPYHAVAVSQSTKNIANILTVTNYGIPEDLTATYTDDDSIAAWGPREARLAMSLHDAVTYLPARAVEVFTRMANPRRSISSISFNAQQDLSVVQQLEIQSRVAVTFEGVTDVLRVVGVSHEVSAGQWLVTLQLSEWGFPEAQSSGIGISGLFGDSSSVRGYRFMESLRFDSSGTFEKADYPWLRALRVKVRGGGGGGGSNVATTSTRFAVSGGGGEGGYAEEFITDIAGMDATVTVTVGAGGAPGTPGDANHGGTGGTSSFGSYLSATGGEGGRGCDATARDDLAAKRGGAGGVGSGGDMNLRGAPGGSGIGDDYWSTSHASGGGGGEGGGTPRSQSVGEDGMHGGGGSGAGSPQSTAARDGGAGGDGWVEVELFA